MRCRDSLTNFTNTRVIAKTRCPFSCSQLSGSRPSSSCLSSPSVDANPSTSHNCSAGRDSAYVTSPRLDLYIVDDSHSGRASETSYSFSPLSLSLPYSLANRNVYMCVPPLFREWVDVLVWPVAPPNGESGKVSRRFDGFPTVGEDEFPKIYACVVVAILS